MPSWTCKVCDGASSPDKLVTVISTLCDHDSEVHAPFTVHPQCVDDSQQRVLSQVEILDLLDDLLTETNTHVSIGT